MGGFFVVPPKAQEAVPKDETLADIAISPVAGENKSTATIQTEEQTEPEPTDPVRPGQSDFSFQYQLLDRLRSDCDYFLGAGQRNEKHLWAGNIQAQLSKMRELYNVVPDKPEWLTEQDMERYEREMTGLEPETVGMNTTTESETIPAKPALDEEEISDLVDLVLCADDVTLDTREWLKELCDFFQGGHKQTTKANALKAFYRSVDTDYTTKTGDDLHITGTDIGLDFETEGQAFSFEYGELVDHIDRLILHGVYPYSAEDSMLDDYAIPDEAGKWNGDVEQAAETVTQEEDEPIPVLDEETVIADFLRNGSGMKCCGSNENKSNSDNGR